MKEAQKTPAHEPDESDDPPVQVLYRIKRGVTLSMFAVIVSLISVVVTILLAPPWYHRQGSAPTVGVTYYTPTYESTSPSTSPSSPAASASLHIEQEFNHAGVPTFANPHNASGPGPQIPYLIKVEVSCKLYDPAIPSVDPDGYWYKISSSPWDNFYYAAANTFLNGDPQDGPYTHNTDFKVPDC